MKVHFFILLLIVSWLSKKITSLPPESRVLGRRSFPHNFVFGTAASAFQYEGATSVGGKSPSIWDYFSHTFPERTNMQNGDVAVDFYHRYKDDIKLMKELNMDAFRFSISWARLIPSGKVKDGVNKEGVQFYNALIDELIANGIQPSMSLYHWDHPQVLEDEYGGFLSPQIIEDFRDFSRVCFEEFGDRVKMWTTINEPYIITVAGYDTGNKAVGRCSKWVNSQCKAGDSATEPYIASHHLLLAHAAAVHEFRKCNKTSQDGQIGIVLSPLWFEPYDSTSLEDNEAVKRALQSKIDFRHLDPVIHGDYPETLKKQVGKRLPSFTAEQSRMLKNSSDFVGVNYYTARYIAHLPHVDPARPRFKTDQQLEWRVTNHSNHQIGPEEDRGILHSVPEGLRKVLNYIKDKYNNPTVYIKENGINDYEDGTKSREDILKDTFRIKYHEDHLEQLHKAIMEDGCDVRGYYAWSLLDNFEWEHGYSTRFGLYYVDYDNNLERYPKDSVNWFKEFLSRVGIKSGQEREEEQVWYVSRERSSQEKNNKTLDDPEGFEASVGTIMYLMTNTSRRKEEERDRCTFDIPYTRLDLLLGSDSSFGPLKNIL
ncbi:beta-glucosidase 28 [Brassica rapa]|uniref:beta-glucosidase 28 n=1 Tax=Brassica campestris TaxID=3711 RepID=UPI00142D9A77|nr:beta-glucosidase 28 [Brassica rapa]